MYGDDAGEKTSCVFLVGFIPIAILFRLYSRYLKDSKTFVYELRGL